LTTPPGASQIHQGKAEGYQEESKDLVSLYAGLGHYRNGTKPPITAGRRAHRRPESAPTQKSTAFETSTGGRSWTPDKGGQRESMRASGKGERLSDRLPMERI